MVGVASRIKGDIIAPYLVHLGAYFGPVGSEGRAARVYRERAVGFLGALSSVKVMIDPELMAVLPRSALRLTPEVLLLLVVVVAAATEVVGGDWWELPMPLLLTE